jgi:hypothetical protein
LSNIFEDVKARVTMRDAIEFLGLKKTEQKGDQFRFPCPACKGKDPRTLSVNTEKGYRCFSSGKSGNDCIALVAHCMSITQSEAAKELQAHFLVPSSTEARRATVEPKGRGESANAVSPLELLGISQEVADRLHIIVEDGRVLFEQRDEHGTMLGTLALATRDDLPLVEWIGQEEVKAPSSLQGLWRVVKGGA